ncbi:MAG: DUF2157 domain-containing protein [Gammaproteobacteria bacterium]|nr:DUF2157 domain-containing protein [Gammaproteobacteria bacterium]MBU1646524.1 DUF2157 domain-containing protein [Gammaproteobacteria bacterium]MBU1973711.1 DUF2157 domain-containing protein [Gammaproteobacteria bacterium]
MSGPTRQQAQQRADAIRTFRGELARLEAEGVLQLDAGQQAGLQAHHDALLAGYAASYDIDRDSRARQLSLGMRVASFLGALALAASVFFLFYQFWGYFGEMAQVAILAGSALASLGLTVWIQGRDPSGYFTKLAALVAFACFVLNISMLGQIWNLTPTDRALLPWAALAFLLAYACDLRLLLAAGIMCIIAWISARVGAWGGIYWLHAGERPENFFPVAALLLALPQFVSHARFGGFDSIYRIFGLLCVFVPMLVLGHWGHGSHLDLDPGTIERGYQLAGFAASALAIWLGARRDWGETVNTGIVFFVIFLYTKFFDWWWQLMPKYLFFLVLGLAAILILLVLRRLRGTLYSRREGAME